MKYSGSTSFDFEIERYRNKFTNELITFNKEVEGDEFGIVFEYTIITLQIEGRSYFQSGRTYGPPEDCYPDEGDTEVEAVIGPDGTDWHNKLTSDEQGQILMMVQDNCMNDTEDYEEDEDYDDEEEDYEPLDADLDEDY